MLAVQRQMVVIERYGGSPSEQCRVDQEVSLLGPLICIDYAICVAYI